MENDLSINHSKTKALVISHLRNPPRLSFSINGFKIDVVVFWVLSSILTSVGLTILKQLVRRLRRSLVLSTVTSTKLHLKQSTMSTRLLFFLIQTTAVQFGTHKKRSTSWPLKKYKVLLIKLCLRTGLLLHLCHLYIKSLTVCLF